MKPTSSPVSFRQTKSLLIFISSCIIVTNRCCGCGFAGISRKCCSRASTRNPEVGLVQWTYRCNVVSWGNSKNWEFLSVLYAFPDDKRRFSAHLITIGCHLCPLLSFRCTALYCSSQIASQNYLPGTTCVYYLFIVFHCFPQ